MNEHRYLIYAYVLGVSLLVSLAATAVMRRIALRLGVMDHPGERKIHRDPVPYLGGVAIAFTFYLIIGAHLMALAISDRFGSDWIDANLLGYLGDGGKVKLAGILAGGFLVFLLGLVDDLRSISPWVKLTGQIVAGLVLALSGLRIELFVLSNVWLSTAVTVFWVVLMTNSLNLLDNMDGLSGGVAVIAAVSFFLTLQPYQDQLVRFLLIIFIGSVAGFLWHNLNPARIFMGDAGALFNGFFLATVAVLGTFHVETTPSRIAVASPLLALSVPLFDTFSVMYIRWRNGQSIMLGDKRHFSHRLVELGMTERQAVGFIYVVAMVAGLGGALLPTLSLSGTIVILIQTAGLYALIVVLMNAGKKNGGRSRGDETEEKE